MLRRPLFWIIFIAVSIAAAIFTIRNFSTAFPLVAIDLRMDREDAMRTARVLSEKNVWPPNAFDEAAEFSADQEVQNFIELEGGGKSELARILKEKIFAPYTWRVRHFKEGDAHETLVRFTPEGNAYGFRLKLPDQEKGESKPREEAQRIAEATARADWNIDFGRYQLVEASQDVRPGGRTDHTFVYERQDERIREGRYRLRLVVGGDKLTELTHFVQVPEAFTRRYEQMRSANDAINAASSIAVFSIYILGFCGIGLFFMVRQRWVLWRQPALWGVFIALLMGLQQLNSWPLVWMGYDTAVSASGFAIRQVLTAVGIFAAFAVLLTISFMAAETLSRRAFPHHIQFWKVWSRPTASSHPAFGQTLSGYLLVAPFFAYEIVLYFFAQGKLGWWTPSDTLVNPDMFANFLPSLSAIAQAAQAGFWEECLFRAAPLATAALIGDKFGKRRLFIAAAMVLQALVFASGHAGYANQPAYARVVELIIPSFAFGTLYLLFGLLPGIVLHFSYDAAWMALPLFVSSGTRAHIEQVIVILAVLVPLWVLILNRVRSGKWNEVPGSELNGGWHPPEVHASLPQEVPLAARSSISPMVLRALPLAGLLGLVAWIFASPFRTDAPPLRINRAEAEMRGRQALADRNIQLDSSWTLLGRVEDQPGEANRFVWQRGGREVYGRLLGVYVTPPGWALRFARFKGDVAERAEEYHVYLDGGGHVLRVSHDLPEARPGKNLSQDEARMLALPAVADASHFKEISAETSKKPARTDWTFVFKDTLDYGLPEGEARASVEIAGDEVADSARYVYVPEEWSRNERARRNLPTIFAAICSILIIAIVAGGAIVGAVYWSRKGQFSARTFFAIFGTLFVLNAINALNNWPALAWQTSTAQPLELQIGIILVTLLVVALFSAAALGLVAGLIAANETVTSDLPFIRSLVVGASVGLGIAGASAIVRQVMPSTTPLWGNLAPASTFIPFIAGALGPLSAFFNQTLTLLTVLYLAHRWRRAAAFWILVGIALTGSSSIETISSWLIVGGTMGILLLLADILVFRQQPQLLVITTATLLVLSLIRDGLQRGYPLALPASIVAVVIVALAARFWFSATVSAERAKQVA